METLKVLMGAKERINAASVEDRLSGIRDLVAAVKQIEGLRPEDQVAALSEVRHTVQELERRVETAVAEYEEAHVWLKVLEGVVRPGEAVPEEAEGEDRVTAARGRAKDTMATVLADAPREVGQPERR